MARIRVQLPESWAHWIDVQMPELGGVRHVKFYKCARLPFEWCLPSTSKFTGMTLFKSIYLRERVFPLDPAKEELAHLVFHELVHVQQFRKNPLLFPLAYLLNLLRFGYWQHPAEVEAREKSQHLLQSFVHDRETKKEVGEL